MLKEEDQKTEKSEEQPIRAEDNRKRTQEGRGRKHGNRSDNFSRNHSGGLSDDQRYNQKDDSSNMLKVLFAVMFVLAILALLAYENHTEIMHFLDKKNAESVAEGEYVAGQDKDGSRAKGGITDESVLAGEGGITGKGGIASGSGLAGGSGITRGSGQQEGDVVRTSLDAEKMEYHYGQDHGKEVKDAVNQRVKEIAPHHSRKSILVTPGIEDKHGGGATGPSVLSENQDHYSVGPEPPLLSFAPSQAGDLDDDDLIVLTPYEIDLETSAFKENKYAPAIPKQVVLRAVAKYRVFLATGRNMVSKFERAQTYNAELAYLLSASHGNSLMKAWLAKFERYNELLNNAKIEPYKKVDLGLGFLDKFIKIKEANEDYTPVLQLKQEIEKLLPQFNEYLYSDEMQAEFFGK